MIAHTTKEIMVNWLQRDFSMSESDARQELEVLYINGLPVLEGFYMTSRRTGLVALKDGRKTRKAIYDSFVNSLNHSSI